MSINLTGDVWITSDTHFFHANIAGPKISKWDKGYRNFDSVEEMNMIIMSHLNTNVRTDDTLIHLGDIVFGEKEKNLAWVRDNLRCKNVICVQGNHDDRHLVKRFFGNCHKMIGDEGEFRINGKKLVLSHYPMFSWPGMGHGSIHLHGHIHSNPRRLHGRSLDVGMDGHNMQPYNLSWLVNYMSAQQVVNEGHH